MSKTEMPNKFRLFDIMILQKQFNFKDIELLKISDIRSHEFVIEFGISILPHEEQQPNMPYIAVLSIVNIYVDKEKKHHIGLLEIGNTFEIADIEKLLSTGRLVIPDEMLYVFVTTAIGNTRGILFGELKSTPLQNVFLPLILTKPIMDDLKKQLALENEKPSS
jgi:hypothetical protein